MIGMVLSRPYPIETMGGWIPTFYCLKLRGTTCSMKSPEGSPVQVSVYETK